MALWCRACPLVTLSDGEPKPLTLVVPYYENKAFFGAQVRRWQAYGRKLQPYLSIIVVDDGSPEHPAHEVLDYLGWPERLRLFRIDVDVRWNWLAARNIGAHYASEGWMLLTDMDHVLTSETLHALIHGAHDPRVVYALSRREHTGVAASPHSASFFLTREMFWTIGGYDEALSGYYGTDGVFRRELVKHAPIHILSDALVRHEYVEDSSTTSYHRKQPEDAAVSRLVAARGKNWTPTTLSFPYREIQAVAG